MAQSVELTFPVEADGALRDQWDRLADAGLPSSRRSAPSPHHAPHITLYAAAAIPEAADARLPGLLDGLQLHVRVGALTIFGPRRGRCVLVRTVLPSAELVALQRAVAELCETPPDSAFAAGRWSPHVTLAPRIGVEQVGTALQVLGEVPELATTVRRCRRWDGDAKTAWWLTGAA